LAAGVCPKNLAFDRKIMALPYSRAAVPQLLPSLYAFDTVPRQTESERLWIFNTRFVVVHFDDEQSGKTHQFTS